MVDSIKLKREGLSNRNDISRVYFELNSKRVSSRASINIDEEAIVSFTPAVVVRAGSTVTLDLVVELANSTNSTPPSATVGAEHSFAITNVEASANVVSSYPVRTNTMRIGSYTVSTVTFDPTSPTSTVDVNVGDKNVVLGEFQLITGGDRDNLFKSITLRNNGGADLASTVANLGLYNDGVKVSSEAVISGRDVTFIVNSIIENGRTENYEIRADIVSSDRDGDELQFELRNETDLNVVEIATNFSAPVVLNGSSDRTMEKYSVKGGELLLSRDSSFTNSDTVSASTNDVVLLSANLRVDEAITVEDLTISYEATGTSLFAQYRDLKLVVDGRTISTYTPKTTDSATGSLQSFDFDGTFLVSNTSNIKILGNLKNNASNGSELEIKNFTINNNTARDVRYVSNDERPSLSGFTFGIAGTVQGIKVSVAESTLLVTKNDGLNNETIVAGARDVTLFGFSMRANDVSDLKVTAIKPTTQTMSGLTLANVTNVRLFEGNNLIRTRNDFDFTSLDITIPKNGSKSFRIVADFDNSVSNNAELRLALSGSSQISARNIESNQLLTTSITGVNSALFNFVTSGTITVSNNSSTRPASIVSPSESQVDVFTFDLEAKNDKLRLTDLYVTRTGTGINLADAVSATSLSVNGRVIDGAVVSAGVLYFPIGSSNPIIIDRDQTVKLEVRVAFSDSNDREPVNFQLALGNTGYTPVNGTVNGLRLVSDSTGQTLTTVTTTGVQSQNHLLARSKPVVAVNSSAVTREVLYRFSVTADSNRYIDLKDFDFTVNSISGVTYSNVSLRVNNSNGTVIGTFDNTVDTFSLSGVYSPNGYRVSAGQTIDFFLTATVDDSARTTTYTRNVKLNNIEFNDSVDDVLDASDYDNTGLEAQTVSFTVNK